MSGKPLRVLPLIALAAAAAGCERGSAEPSAAPPVAAVEVPAVPPETERAPASFPLPERRSSTEDDLENAGNVGEERAALEDDAGVVQFSTASDAGVRFWGSFRALDGGFSFRGSFSIGATSAADAAGNASP
jgi:hypothetical protein